MNYHMDSDDFHDSYDDSEGIEYTLDHMCSDLLKELESIEVTDEGNESRLVALRAILSTWAKKITRTMKKAILTIPSTASSVGDDESKLNTEHQLIKAITTAHESQVQEVKEVFAQHRKESSKDLVLFEDNLKNKYDNIFDTFKSRVNMEEENLMHRVLENVDKKLEAIHGKYITSLESKNVESEHYMCSKFKGILTDLKQTWENQESGRSTQLEKRLKSYYKVVLDHMQEQLSTALKVQDEADKQWLEDIEARSQQQIETLKAFEDKCKRLYETRLIEYAEKTQSKIDEYENQLLDAATTVTEGKAQFESRLRRIKLSCNR